MYKNAKIWGGVPFGTYIQPRVFRTVWGVNYTIKLWEKWLSID